MVTGMSQTDPTFKELVLADVKSAIVQNKPDYDYVLANTAWQNVAEGTSLLTMYGRDIVEPPNFVNYLKDKLSDVILSGSGVLVGSDLDILIKDLNSSLKWGKEAYRTTAFSSMETHAGGSLRASVAVLLVRKLNSPAGDQLHCFVYKSIYDITAKSNAHWHNGRNHLDKAKGWAIYKAMHDFQTQCDQLLEHLTNDSQNVEIRKTAAPTELINYL